MTFFCYWWFKFLIYHQTLFSADPERMRLNSLSLPSMFSEHDVEEYILLCHFIHLGFIYIVFYFLQSKVLLSRSSLHSCWEFVLECSVNRVLSPAQISVYTLYIHKEYSHLSASLLLSPLCLKLQVQQSNGRELYSSTGADKDFGCSKKISDDFQKTHSHKHTWDTRAATEMCFAWSLIGLILQVPAGVKRSQWGRTWRE